jgi:hypothetical protein
VHIATLSSITSDDAASGGGDAAVGFVPAQTDSSDDAGAGLSINLTTDATNLTTDATTDPAPTLGPVQDKNSATDPPTLGPVDDKDSAWDEHLVGTSGAGSLTAHLGPTTSDGAAAGSGGGNVSPALTDNSLHLVAFGVGNLDALMSGAGVIGPSGFDAGSVFAGAGSEGGANGLTGTGAALTGAFSSSAGQSQDSAAGSLNLDGQLSQLVQAMATYSADSPAFASSPFTQVSNDSGLLGAIAAAGHV